MLRLIGNLLIVCSLAMVGADWAEAQTAHDLFQQALVKERADGDLRGAIAIYEHIVRAFTEDRTLMAKALVQMGQCYEKLGSTEAERAYRRVVREFADQDDLVVRAQSRLAALQRAALAADAPSITTRRVSVGMNVGAHDPTPDGKHLVWGDFQGTMNLAVREVATGKSRYLTQDARYTPTWATAYGGRVSRDGEWVAYGFSEQDQGGSLRVVGMDGENQRELLREKGCWAQPHGWTSDGKHIAARWDCWSESNPDGTFKMVLVSVADARVRLLREVPSQRYGFRSWLSPDDRYLVYHGPVEQDDGNFDIWLLPLDGGDNVPLIQHPADDGLLGWVPGTDQVLFLSDRDGTNDLWAVSVKDGANAGSPRKVRRDVGGVSAVGFSEDGSFFYSVFTRWFGTSVAPFDVHTGMADLEAATPLLGSNREPHWSPDGEYLAFVAEPQPPESKRGRMSIRHLATGEQRELAAHLRVRWVGDWSPDGRSILASARDTARDDPTYAGALFAVDAESGRATQLFAFPEGFGSGLPGVSAVWSPDGKSIIYSIEGRLVHRELGSGEERELYRDSLIIWRPLELSPDGRALAFVVDDAPGVPGVDGLVVLDLESGDAHRIVASADLTSGKDIGLQWTPDSKYLLFSQRMGEGNDSRSDVLRVAVSGGEPEDLWTFGERKYSGHFSLSPDGRQIALTTYTQETEIWVMEGLKEVLRQQP